MAWTFPAGTQLDARATQRRRFQRQRGKVASASTLGTTGNRSSTSMWRYVPRHPWRGHFPAALNVDARATQCRRF
ncbi:hypothetical protein [Aliidiomarina iranensis]|uniref:hypothetical protein n=1 Tax=Aliidiomarina iranensis TaxID=1434071 RepID=UPI000F85F799|nr:hypothetical protein [Aliidiomarina iranensis]